MQETQAQAVDRYVNGKRTIGSSFAPNVDMACTEFPRCVASPHAPPSAFSEPIVRPSSESQTMVQAPSAFRLSASAESRTTVAGPVPFPIGPSAAPREQTGSGVFDAGQRLANIEPKTRSQSCQFPSGNKLSPEASPKPEVGVDALRYDGMELVPLMFGETARVPTPATDWRETGGWLNHVCAQEKVKGFSAEELRLKWIVAG